MNAVVNLGKSILSLFFILILAACGGGGGGSSSSAPPASGGGSGGAPDDPVWTAGVYEDDDLFKNYCENPRTFTDIDGNPYPDVQGSTVFENHWLRSWSNDTYLWYDELPDVDPATYDDPLDYFDILVTSELSPSGNPKDRFHFTYETTEYELLTQAGVSVSYGIEWELVSRGVPRQLIIRYVEPGSPAAAANLTRGVEVIEIDGVDVQTASSQEEVAILNEGLYPSNVGDRHTFIVRDVGSSTTRSVTLRAEEVSYDPVPLVRVFNTQTGPVGYVFFNDHNFVSEDELYDAMSTMSNNNVTDLVLDLRYNGGGFLYIASQVGYMIAGSQATNGKNFETLRFNDKYPTRNPVTGQLINPTPFYSSTSQYSERYGPGRALPQLNLNRVFVLTTDGTCSASEAIINSLRGIDVEVIQIGSTTCGKPYGFYATDNCGTTYFTIQFDGINDKGEGGYSDGFTPVNAPVADGILQNGCYVAEDLTSTLGATNEPLIAAALEYRATGQCPAITKFDVYRPYEPGGLGESEEFLRQMKIYKDVNTGQKQ